MYTITDLDIMDPKAFVADALMYGLYVRRDELNGCNGYDIYSVAHPDRLYLAVAMSKIYFDGDQEMALELMEEA
jgi:hypothetical protein